MSHDILLHFGSESTISKFSLAHLRQCLVCWHLMICFNLFVSDNNRSTITKTNMMVARAALVRQLHSASTISALWLPASPVAAHIR